MMRVADHRILVVDARRDLSVMISVEVVVVVQIGWKQPLDAAVLEENVV